METYLFADEATEAERCTALIEQPFNMQRYGGDIRERRLEKAIRPSLRTRVEVG